MREVFRVFSHGVAATVGSPWAFCLAIVVVVLWALCGPYFNYSDTWQLVINTGTTIITFLMVFVIQNTQNRDSKALHLKLDELIKVNQAARDSLVNIENLSEEEIKTFEEEFSKCNPKACDEQSGSQN